jgi:NAD(P)-dependent dehydrogenase (short-subunit alcohol dehydrogenase family)
MFRTSVKFSKTVLGEGASLCSTATHHPFVLASLSMKHGLRVLEPRGRGSIVNISLMYGHEGTAGAAVYAAS